MKVLIADAKHQYHRFIKQVLERRGDLKVVGEAADGEEVIRLAHRLKPDVVLMDIDLHGTDAFDATNGFTIRRFVESGRDKLLKATECFARARSAVGYCSDHAFASFSHAGTVARERSARIMPDDPRSC